MHVTLRFMHVILKVDMFGRRRSQTAVRVVQELIVKQRNVQVFRGTSVCEICCVITWERTLLWQEHATSVIDALCRWSPQEEPWFAGLWSEGKCLTCVSDLIYNLVFYPTVLDEFVKCIYFCAIVSPYCDVLITRIKQEEAWVPESSRLTF